MGTRSALEPFQTLSQRRVSIEYEHINGSYPDGTSYSLLKPVIKIDNWGYGEPGNLLKSTRVASAVYGLGLLDAIADESILALADPEDRDNDGISGRANRVWSPSKQTHSIGKYGWKANKATLLDQAAGGFSRRHRYHFASLSRGESFTPTVGLRPISRRRKPRDRKSRFGGCGLLSENAGPSQLPLHEPRILPIRQGAF